MKRLFMLILSCALVLSMAVPAWAQGSTSDSVQLTGTVGSEANWVLNKNTGYSVSSVNEVEGSIPEGMTYRVRSNGELLLSGTPTEYGNFSLLFHVEATDDDDTWDADINVDIHIEQAGKQDYTLSTYKTTLKLNEYTKLSFGMDCAGNIGEIKLNTDKLPSGMTRDHDEDGIYIMGTPDKKGTYEFTVKAYNSKDECWVSQPCVITVKGEGVPVVTKNPTGEAITEGEKALFVAKADDADKISWTIISPDGNNKYAAKDAPSHFPGLKISGETTEVLTLSSVPYSMNGCTVKAKFTGPDGSVESKAATLTVVKQSVQPPTIRIQPIGTELKLGENATVSVTAASTDGTAIRYQWFKNSVNSNSGGTAIPGATDSVYSVSYSEGTTYYYCELRCTEDGMSSETVTTQCAAVNGIAPETVPTTEATEATTEATSEFPTEAPTEPAKPHKSSVLPMVIAAIVMVSALCTAGALIYRFGLPIGKTGKFSASRHSDDDEFEYIEEDENDITDSDEI